MSRSALLSGMSPPPARVLAVGPVDGRPVVYFHGWPGSADEVGIFATEARSRRLRVIGIDRPGTGGTPALSLANLTAAACWYRRVIRGLRLGRVELMANSAGTPFAIATATLLGSQARRLIIASGLPPQDRAGQGLRHVGDRITLAAARRCPGALRLLFLAALSSRRRHRPLMARSLAPDLCPSDREALADADHRGHLDRAIRAAMCQRGVGPVQDLRLIAADEASAASRLDLPIRAFHGDADAIVAADAWASVRRYGADARCSVVPNEGHFSLLRNQTGRLLAARG